MEARNGYLDPKLYISLGFTQDIIIIIINIITIR
jgi:hypothetical protein